MSYRSPSVIFNKGIINSKFIRCYSKVINLEKKANEIKDPLIIDKFSSIRDKYQTPHYPIVLCHGLSGFDKVSLAPPYLQAAAAQNSFLLFDYWRGIKGPLEKMGTKVITGKVPPFGTISERASILDEFISKQCKELRKNESKSTIYNSGGHSHTDATFKEEHSQIKVNLISHSMGGLDCRYLISKLQNKYYKVVLLTTISTPHHGSECADFLVHLIGKSKILRKLCPDSIYELTTASMAKFNVVVTDDPSVQYFSYGAKFDPKWYSLFSLSWHIMKHQSKYGKLDNDGMVSVESSKWGKYLGTLSDVDHLDLINWTSTFRKDDKFNALALYLDIADQLAKRGF